MGDIWQVFFPGSLLGIPSSFLGMKIPSLTKKTLVNCALLRSPGQTRKTYMLDQFLDQESFPFLSLIVPCLLRPKDWTGPYLQILSAPASRALHRLFYGYSRQITAIEISSQFPTVQLGTKTAVNGNYGHFRVMTLTSCK